MTDFVLSDPRCTEATGLAERISCLWHNWRVRLRVRSMLDLDDRVLADIGVRRDEVEWASRLPLSINAATHLENASWSRRRAYRRRTGRIR